MDTLCQGCGRIVSKKALTYRLRLELFASPEPPDLSDADLAGDLRAEWDALLGTLEQLSDEQAQEAIDQVHEQYEFVLCPTCRRLWHERLQEICSQFGP